MPSIDTSSIEVLDVDGRVGVRLPKEIPGLLELTADLHGAFPNGIVSVVRDCYVIPGVTARRRVQRWMERLRTEGVQSPPERTPRSRKRLSVDSKEDVSEYWFQKKVEHQRARRATMFPARSLPEPGTVIKDAFGNDVVVTARSGYGFKIGPLQVAAWPHLAGYEGVLCKYVYFTTPEDYKRRAAMDV